MMKYHIHTACIQVQKKMRKRERKNTRNYREQNSIDYITKHIQFLNQCATAKVAKLSKDSFDCCCILFYLYH